MPQTIDELIEALQKHRTTEGGTCRVMISGLPIQCIDIVPAEGRCPKYLDLVA